MKRILFIIILFLGSTFILLVYFIRQREIEEDFYVLPQNKSYVYEEGRRMSFEIYSKRKDTLICYPENNQYILLMNDLQYTLNNVSIEIIQQKNINLCILSCDVIKPVDEEFYEEKVELEIRNTKYKVKFFVGSLSILSPVGYTKLLGVDTFYASYAYVDSVLELVGLNITFSNKYSKLAYARIGRGILGNLAETKMNTLLENEIEILTVVPKYDIKTISEWDPIDLEGRTCFIPMAYDNLYPTRQGYIVFHLDNELYYLDTFGFIANEFEFEDYKALMKKGDIQYA